MNRGAEALITADYISEQWFDEGVAYTITRVDSTMAEINGGEVCDGAAVNSCSDVFVKSSSLNGPRCVKDSTHLTDQ